jgi:hypothetical protein
MQASNVLLLAVVGGVAVANLVLDRLAPVMATAFGRWLGRGVRARKIPPGRGAARPPSAPGGGRESRGTCTA